MGSGAAGLTKVGRVRGGRSIGAPTIGGGGAGAGTAAGGGGGSGAGAGAGGTTGRAMEAKRSHGLEGGGWFDIGPDEVSLAVLPDTVF